MHFPPYAKHLLAQWITLTMARAAARVASTTGEEIIERLARSSTRAGLERLGMVLRPAQFAMLLEVHDVLRAYASRASEREAPPYRPASNAPSP